MQVATRKCFIEQSVQFEEDRLCDPPPSEAQEGITNLPLYFDDDDLLYVSNSNKQDQVQHDVVIEAEPHEILDLDPTPIPNQIPKPRWAQNIIDAVGDGAGNPEDRRRTRSQYQNEDVALSLTDSLPTDWCNKVPGKCYMMVANDQLFGPQKKKNDLSLHLPYRRNTYHIHQIIRTMRVSHAHLQDVVAQKNHVVAQSYKLQLSFLQVNF